MLAVGSEFPGETHPERSQIEETDSEDQTGDSILSEEEDEGIMFKASEERFEKFLARLRRSLLKLRREYRKRIARWRQRDKIQRDFFNRMAADLRRLEKGEEKLLCNRMSRKPSCRANDPHRVDCDVFRAYLAGRLERARNRIRRAEETLQDLSGPQFQEDKRLELIQIRIRR